MVTDRAGPTITTLKAEVDYLDGEVKKLLNLLADARTENMKLRAVIERVYQSSNQPHIIEMTRAALEGK